MTFRFARMLFALAAPLLLASCLTPGRFTATLEINRDRSFTFTYVGEAVVADPSAGIQMTMQGAEGAPPPSSEQPQEMPEGDRQRIIEALSREVGFRSVEYVGQNKFRIDYAISGRLDRSFVFPMNPEGMAILPWLLVEVRRDGTAQVSDETRTQAAQWRLLLQLDTDDSLGVMWGDSGRIYFWMREEDLRSRAFDRAWCILQCY